MTTDPLPRTGRFGDVVIVRTRVEEVTGRGATARVRSPVLVIGDAGWRAVVPGQRLSLTGRLDAAESSDLSAVLLARGPPTVVSPPGPVAARVNALRAGLRRSVADLPPAERALVPALVVGDDAAMPAEVADDFRTAGLTHLLAVSGTNLTLVLAFVLTTGRWCGVRARGLLVLGVLGVVGFVLLARPQPSVLRAAAMGVVALAGLTAGGQRRGVRALCAAVLALVLLDPWLARSPGFLLSVLATAGILVLAPGWRDRMASWLPRPVAEVISVPLAAQVVCTPVVAALSGQVSVVAVAANLLAAPAVGPATVLGVVATLAAVVSDRLAAVAGWLAGRAAWWIVAVAERGAALPGADLPWPVSTGALVGLTLCCAGVIVGLTRLLRRPGWSLLVAGVLVVAVTRPVGSLLWPPAGWRMVACDVGQGDALVLRAGEGAGVVVDTGPDPSAVDRCLSRLGVSRVPLVVLTHLHADHTGGLAGVLDGRDVAEIQVGAPALGSADVQPVRRLAVTAGVPLTATAAGERRRVAGLSWTVLHPRGDQPVTDDAVNNSSVVMVAQSAGVRLLLTGDIEEEAQQELLASATDLDVDVLKVPHHGSAAQHEEFLAATDPELAVVSAGEDNPYGHPAPSLLHDLEALGATVLRTDRAGDVAVVATATGVATASR